ncbi:helix-turn-helix transcriptional regulator [Phascolarctobacterium succinatutens]|uniref:helix-turn-helix transcriptional regulator n=1 Tax=Phascolarctobacterium succinatutens TaxID=626940 RepID=UPI00307A3054
MLKRRRTFQAQEVGELDFSEELLELGVLIGSYRTARGIKQEEMAKMIGVSRRTMTKIENGRQTLSLVIFFRIAALFEVRPVYLLQELAMVTQRKWSRKGED